MLIRPKHLPVIMLFVLSACDGGDANAPEDPGAGTTTTGSDPSPLTSTSVSTSESTASPSTDPSEDSTTAETGGSEVGTGSSDETGVPTEPPRVCVEDCAEDLDCASGFVCGDAGFCAPAACPDDDWCVASLSGLTQEGCASSDVCDAGDCVLVGSHSFCATPSGGSCFESSSTEVMTAEGGTSTICLFAARCGDDAVCLSACTADDDCFGFIHPSCNTDTGACECTADSCGDGSTCSAGQCSCTSDEGCSPLAGGSVCNDGTCGCADDGDCVLPGADTCIDGVCSCGDDASCSDFDSHPGGQPMCVPQ